MNHLPMHATCPAYMGLTAFTTLTFTHARIVACSHEATLDMGRKNEQKERGIMGEVGGGEAHTQVDTSDAADGTD